MSTLFAASIGLRCIYQRIYQRSKPASLVRSLATMTSEEKQIRYDLCVAHAAFHHFKMDELVWNHVSARYPKDSWLITPGLKHWDEISPSCIIPSSANVTADIIHSSVYSARPDVNAVVHLHTRNAVAVGCLKEGYEGLTQDGSYFHDSVAYHEWEGVSDDPGEGVRIGENIRKVPGCNILVMPNHGFCSLGRSVKEAWIQAFYFEKACETQMVAFAAGEEAPAGVGGRASEMPAKCLRD